MDSVVKSKKVEWGMNAQNYKEVSSMKKMVEAMVF
jgi:hypothetical protein